MCTVSMIGDHYHDKWRDRQWYPQTQPPWPQDVASPAPYTQIIPLTVTRDEFDNLRKEVEEMKALLVRAKAYDEKNGEPDCEMASKMKILRAVAAAVDVNLDDILRAGT